MLKKIDSLFKTFVVFPSYTPRFVSWLTLTYNIDLIFLFKHFVYQDNTKSLGEFYVFLFFLANNYHIFIA